MGGNRINVLLASVLMLALAIWGVSYILTLRDPRLQLAIVGVLGVVFALLSIKPKYALDFKLLLFVIFGYFAAGKGFAYLSPQPPFYIGEIFFLMASVGVVLRTRLDLVSIIKINKLNVFILIACTYSLLRLLLVDFDQYKMLSLRDSAMVYYSFIALACSVFLQEEKYQKVFAKCFPYFIGLGFLSFVVVMALMGKFGVMPYVSFFYMPHVDVAIPVTASLAMGGFFLLGGKGKALGEQAPKLVIAGQGAMESAVQAAAANSCHLEYRGLVDGEEKSRLIESCRGMLAPSVWQEPLGLVTYEAQDDSRAMFAAASGGLKETTEHGVTGFLHVPGDYKQLAEQIITYQACSKDERRKMGAAGRVKLLTDASVEKWQKQFIKIVGDVVGG